MQRLACQMAKKKSGKSSSKKSGRKSKSVVNELEVKSVDMLDSIPMLNLYYTAHGPVEALQLRGFAPQASGKKGKKKGKKK